MRVLSPAAAALSRGAFLTGGFGSLLVSFSTTGVPACASDYLLRDTLRYQWGFDGYVVRYF